MSETSPFIDAPNPADAVAGADATEESGAKEQIYAAIDAFVKNKTGKRIGKSGGQEIFNLVVGQIFAVTAKEGQLRFNGGFGSLHMKTYQPGSRRLPSGATAQFGERDKIRYEEGVVVKALIKNGGNLDAALQVRGSRETKKAPAAPKPAAPQSTAPATSGSETEGDVDLS